MNRKQVIFLLLAMAVIGGAGLVLLKRNKESWAVPEAKMGDKVLPNFQPNAVAAIHIKGVSDLNLVHTNDLWRVQERGGYPANFHQLSDLLIKLKDLKVLESETVAQSDLARVNLDEPGKGSSSGTLVEFKDGQGKVLDALLVGKKHMREASPSPFARNSADGCYILLPGDPKDVLLISDALAGLQPNPQQWLSKDFFKVEKIESLSLTTTNAANSWKLVRATESSPWVLIDSRPGEALDTNKATMTTATLGFPTFADVAVDTNLAETGLDKPMVVAIETFEHFTYTLKIGAKSPGGNYYVTVVVTAEIPTQRVAGTDEKPDDKKKLDQEFQDETKKLQSKLVREQSLAPWVYMVGSWIVDPLLHDRAQLLKEKKEEKSADQARPPQGSVSPEIAPLLIK